MFRNVKKLFSPKDFRSNSAGFARRSLRRGVASGTGRSMPEAARNLCGVRVLRQEIQRKSKENFKNFNEIHLKKDVNSLKFT